MYSSLLYSKVIYLVTNESVMVLSTVDISVNIPWSAAVYFLYENGNFYFLSSPKSRHISESIRSSFTAISIFSQTKSLRKINGLQMLGGVSKVKSIESIGRIVKKYFIKFDSVRELFPFSGKHVKIKDFFKRFSVELYKFTPTQSFYTDNSFGFGFRKEISFV